MRFLRFTIILISNNNLIDIIMFQKIFLCVIAVLLAYPTNAQYQDVFD